jgi:transposase-like protein
VLCGRSFREVYAILRCHEKTLYQWVKKMGTASNEERGHVSRIKLEF